MSQLRESWDQTEAAVHRRLGQLETARLDSASWEAGRAELAAWLTRLEVRLDQLAPVGHTADLLETQIKEQKVSLVHRSVSHWRHRSRSRSVWYTYQSVTGDTDQGAEGQCTHISQSLPSRALSASPLWLTAVSSTTDSRLPCD